MANFKVLCSLLTLLTAVNALPQVKLGKATLVGEDVSQWSPILRRRPVLKTQLPPTTFNATSYGKACIQPALFDAAPPQSEDCLFINVYRPTGVPLSKKLPYLSCLVFYSYGGGFVVGSADQFDGKDLVARSVERDRFSMPLYNTADDKRALNLGVLDQIAALEWVQANIHAFGGDKDKVTIVGESAGAMMTGVLFLNPELGKLARAGILESGSSNGVVAAVWKSFVEAVPACLSVAATGKTSRPAALQSISESFSLIWAPTLDSGHGSVYPDYPSRPLREGYTSPGCLSLQAPIVMKQQYFPAATTDQELNKTVDALLKLYPRRSLPGKNSFGLPASYKRVASLMGDMTFDAPRRQWSQVAAKAGIKSYGYHFTHPQPEPALGVPHGAEMPYVYAQPPSTDAAGQENQCRHCPEWPQYTTKNQVLLQLEGGNTTVVKDDFRKEQIDFLMKNALVLRR
ncbi:triacylglycerol lipase 3 [Ephemerocybe angulata]|uniref:Carboxylic ester hydrolase n=1 Tax=Ephemerocybe angulata TaxID=980116 RepID=A0A8H6LYN3_9AGAR|nr:triacylglycerol lipase 3 [Tulosesus angulatus]